MTTVNWPRISMVTPSYKAGDLIEQTLQSVLSQGYPNLEYIVIDGAGDHTDTILEKYDKQLAYWCSQPDNGQYDALNKGFSIATGDIFCWLNADDMLLPRALFVVAEIFRKFGQVQWLSTLKPGFWDANGYLSHVGHTPGFSKEAFLDGCFLPGTRKWGHWLQQESTFFTSEIWKKSGARIPDYDLAGDFALWCEFYEHTDLYGVDYPLAGFRHIIGQRSEAKDKYLSEARSSLEAMRKLNNWHESWQGDLRYSRLSRLPKLQSKITNNFGYTGNKIVNRDIRRIGAEWEIISHKWLP